MDYYVRKRWKWSREREESDTSGCNSRKITYLLIISSACVIVRSVKSRSPTRSSNCRILALIMHRFTGDSLSREGVRSSQKLIGFIDPESRIK